jgi:hypothetical protein
MRMDETVSISTACGGPSMQRFNNCTMSSTKTTWCGSA